MTVLADLCVPGEAPTAQPARRPLRAAEQTVIGIRIWVAGCVGVTCNDRPVKGGPFGSAYSSR